MAEALKNLFNQRFFEVFTDHMTQITNGFDKEKFLKEIYSPEWDKLELKERMRHITLVIKPYLEEDYKDNIQQILKLTELFQNDKRLKEIKYGALGCIFLPDFIEMYGQKHLELSCKAMERITQFISCEFAIRPFIIQYEEEMIEQLKLWSNHENEHVRRLASEGCRPRLPWAMALPAFKKDPTPILPILDTLKSDSSEYVRRSVANNLNDISKDHPQKVIELAKAWKGESPEVDWVIKHACRTLLKDGNKDVMQIFGFGSIEDIGIENFQIIKKTVKMGGDVKFSFDLHNHSEKAEKVRLEYGVYYMKKNGSLSRKVFKISEKLYEPKSISKIEKKQSFKLITTRKFYAGEHMISIIVNGEEVEERTFELIE
jgi:3-methyladenine DNA glycosylase AlkC